MANKVRKAGKFARFSINGTFLAAEEWSGEDDDTMPDVSNTEGGGFTDVISGMGTFTGSFKGFWDSNNNPHASPPNVNRGQELTNVVYWRDASTSIVTLKKVLVKKVRVSMQVKDKIMLDFDFQSKATDDGTAAYTWNSTSTT